LHKPVHSIFEQVGVAMLLAEHTIPQPPQLIVFVAMAVSQPSFALWLQSAVPYEHATPQIQPFAAAAIRISPGAQIGSCAAPGGPAGPVGPVGPAGP
jgi:hypothetical protein